MKPPVRLVLLLLWHGGKLTLLSLIASVDYETDRKIQDTIAAEFEDRTILCIAREFPVKCARSESGMHLTIDFTNRPTSDHYRLR